MRHAPARLAERYGVHRNQTRVVAALKWLVLHGQAKFRRPLEGGRSEWVAYVVGRRVRLVWDEGLREVVTVLPEKRRGRRGTEAG